MDRNSNVYKMCACAVMTALMAALCPLSVPIGPIPVSLSVLVILIVVYLLGTRSALISYCVYMLLGAAGMPVFSGFQGGLIKLTGPTGGYLIGFVPMIMIAGYFIKRSGGRFTGSVLGMALGVMAAYLFGTVWFVLMMHCGVMYALSVCVLPFIPIDLAKIVAAAIFGKAIKRALIKAHLLPEP